jgi:N6-adenosine-specific RNA methylase IME4
VTRYRTIVADPPWHYGEGWPCISTSEKLRPGYQRPVDADFSRRKPIPYPTMNVEAIAALPVGDLAERDAHLYLWTTNRYLREAFGVVEAWGFRFSQVLIWPKKPMGIGVGGTFQTNAEFILFARRGSLKAKTRLDTCWFPWPRLGNAHSGKPPAMQDMVEQVSPGPYVELFARRDRLGWDTWGDESLQTAEMPAA